MIVGNPIIMILKAILNWFRLRRDYIANAVDKIPPEIKDALGLGIAGTALALFNNGFGGNLFGCRGAAADGAVAAASIANERYLERKQCADHVQFVNDMWRTSYNQQNQRFEDRQTINQEMFWNLFSHEKWF